MFYIWVDWSADVFAASNADASAAQCGIDDIPTSVVRLDCS